MQGEISEWEGDRERKKRSVKLMGEKLRAKKRKVKRAWPAERAT